jgi:hypothetical protein
MPSAKLEQGVQSGHLGHARQQRRLSGATSTTCWPQCVAPTCCIIRPPHAFMRSRSARRAQGSHASQKKRPNASAWHLGSPQARQGASIS